MPQLCSIRNERALLLVQPADLRAQSSPARAPSHCELLHCARAWGQRRMGSKNSQTTPATTSTSSIRQLLGAADAQTARHATFSTAPAHQRRHRPQRPTESSDPTQHAKGRTGDCPGPRKGATTRRNVSRGVSQVEHFAFQICDETFPAKWFRAMWGTSCSLCTLCGPCSCFVELVMFKIWALPNLHMTDCPHGTQGLGV